MTTSIYRHLKRNFSLFLIDYVVFSTGAALIGSSTVVPDFVSHITSDPGIIGISGSLFNFCWLLPQLIYAQVINRSTHRTAILSRIVVPLRTIFVILALIMSIIHNANIILIIFLICYGLFAAGDGFVTLIWADMLGSTLPNRARSILFSVGQFGVALAALGAREIIRRSLAPDSFPFPLNYAQLFGIAGVLFLCAGVALSLLREEQAETPLKPGPSFREYFPYLGRVLRTDGEFRHFAGMRVLFDLATMSIPFYIIFGKDLLHVDSQTLVGNSILVITMGNAVGSIAMGWLSRRYGSRAVIRLAGIAILLEPLLALSSTFTGVIAIYGIFFVLGIANAGIAPGYFDWVITHAPSDRRPIYMGLTNTISAISNLAPAVGGLILGVLLLFLSSNLSYMVLFLISASMAVGGLVATLALSEPRHKTQ